MTLNESWMHVRGVLQAELEEERRQKEQMEATFEAEEAEVQKQVEQAQRQLDNMRSARRSLGKHRISMAKIKADMLNEIKEERRMTEEISQEGEKQLNEWREKQAEIREELNEALAQQKGEHDLWKAGMVA